MGDDDEVMRFEITDQDLEDEMTSSYGKKRMSKNKQIYGVWADNSDSEEEARPSFGGIRMLDRPLIGQLSPVSQLNGLTCLLIHKYF